MPRSPAEELRRSWVIVAISVFGMCFGGSGVLWYSFGVLVNPLHDAYGWSSSVVSGWASFVSIGSIIGLPTAGRLADRFGVRPVVLYAMPLCAAAISAAVFVNGHIWILYTIAVLVGTLAAGISSLTYSRVINGWFESARGTALGMMSAGIGIGATIGPRLIQSVVDHLGLRAGFLALGLTLLLPFPVMLRYLHERRDNIADAPRSEEGLTRSQSLRHPVFWLLGAASVLWTVCAGGNFHLVSFLTAGGLNRVQAATYVGTLGITAMFGRLVTGYIIDRISAPVVCATVFVIESVAFCSLAVINVRYAFLPIMVIGCAHGAEVDCFAYCTARYFGLKSYGSIFALLSVLAAVGNGVGPLLFGVIQNLTNSYRDSYFTDGVLALGAASLLAVVARYPYLSARKTSAGH